MSWSGAPLARRAWPRLAVAVAVLVPAFAVVFGAAATRVLAAPSAGVDVTITVDGHDALAPAAAEVGTDGVLAVAVELDNDLPAAATVTVAGEGSLACNHTLAPGADATCTGAQFAPTALGLTERDVRVTTQADWTALGLGPLTAVTYGERHGCALDAAQQAWCWGVNQHGRLGDGTTLTRTAAVRVAGAHKFVAIAAGQHHTCAIDTAGEAWCWGLGSDGQLGNNSSATSHVPVKVTTTATAQPFAAITAGDTHTCALSVSGRGWCWGDGTNGRTGWGSTADALAPRVVGSQRTYRSIDAGGSASCAVVATDAATSGAAAPGTLMCWGSGYTLTPAAVGTGDWRVVDVGANHACALATADSTAWCWGQNASGQLGNGTTGASAAPVAVSGAQAFDSIVAGNRYTCAVAAGVGSCWGESDGARLGVDGADQLTPQPLGGEWSQIAAGSAGSAAATTCALTATAAVRCWGAVSSGEAGAAADAAALAPATSTATPLSLAGTVVDTYSVRLHTPGAPEADLATFVDGEPASEPPGPWTQGGRPIDKTYEVTNTGDVLLGAVAVVDANGPAVVCPGGALAPGASMTCAARATMSATIDTDLASTATATARPVVPAAALAAGASHTCVATDAAVAWCWGSNATGQLGTGAGSPTTATSAQHVAAFTPFLSLDAGNQHTCGLTDAGAAWCWGQGTSGQLGTGSIANAPAPVTVVGGHEFSAISAGGTTTCALTDAGALWCWGSGNGGAGGSTHTSPTSVGAGSYRAVSVGTSHTCVLTETYQAACFGTNDKGELGVATGQSTPATAVTGHAFTAISAGDDFTCALDAAGLAWCWGWGLDGRLGNGAALDSPVPLAVTGGHTFATISTGGTAACAIGRDAIEGELWCWGKLATGVSTNVPVRIGAGSDWTDVAVGGSHQCVRDVDGGVACWGSNGSGQIGDGSTAVRTSPAPAFVVLDGGVTSPVTPVHANWQPSRVLTLGRTLNGAVVGAAQIAVPAGNPLTLGYTITNAGRLALTDVTVTEPGVSLTCPSVPVLAPGASFMCSATAPALTAGAIWQSTATATAAWHDVVPYSGQSGTIDAHATASAWADAAPTLALSATVNGDDAAGTGVEVPAGSTAHVVYTVTNTGPVAVGSLMLTNAPGTLACAAGALAPGASTTCSTTVPAPAPGATTALQPTAHATWAKPDATVVSVSITRTFRAWTDATPTISVTARIGGATPPAPTEFGLGFASGATIPVRFEVLNTGPVAVSGLTLAVDVGGSSVAGVTCPGTVAPNATVACTGAVPNAHLPTPVVITGAATATWVNQGGVVRTATGSASETIYTEPAPGLSLQTQIGFVPAAATDAAPGAAVAAGVEFAVLYTVTNSGDVPLADVVVDNGHSTVTCAVALAVGATRTCSAPFPPLAAGALFVNTATAHGTWTNLAGEAISETTSDTVYAWASATPSLAVAAQIGGVPQPSAPGARFEPGAPIAVRLDVTNTGPVALSGLHATLTLGNVACPPSIAPGATVACTGTVTAPNIGGVVAFAPQVSAHWSDPGGTQHAASNTAPLFAWVDKVPTLSLRARIAGADADAAPGVEVAPDAAPTMTYVVTNTSGVPLTGLSVNDPGVAVACPSTALAAGATITCTGTRAAPGPGAQIAATATATATWTAPDNSPRTAQSSDKAHAWSDAEPALAIAAVVGTALTDPAPGPRIAPGTLTLRAVVTNTGSVAVSAVTAEDSIAGALGCPLATLPAGQSMTCTTTTATPAAGAVWSSSAGARGQWANAVGAVREATAIDEVHAWVAAEPSISLTVRPRGLGASAPPGLQVEPQNTVPVTFVVTNTSAVTVDEVAVAAPGVESISCPSALLAPAAKMECTGTFVAPGGGQLVTLRATASAGWNDPTGARLSAGDDDAAYLWTPGRAGLVATVRVNGHADTGDGVAVAPDVPAMVAVLVFNTGNVALRDLTVDTSPSIGLRCPGRELSVDGVMSCTATLTGPADGATLELAVHAEATWFDQPAGTTRAVAHAADARIVGSQAAPAPVITLDPARLFETRPGLATADGLQNGVGRLADGAAVVVRVAGRGGVPADAASAVLNLTATNAGQPGYITAWPCDTARPLASSLNYVPGRTVANSIVARLDDHGDVCLYALREVDLIVDVNGYALVDGLESVAPARLLDTRPGHTTADGIASGAGVVPARGVVRVQVAGRGGVPGDATVAVLNVVATEPSGAGYVTVYPCDGALPNASTVNYLPGETVANGLVAKLDADGGVCLLTHAAAHLVVDVNAHAGAHTGVSALVPSRLVDTRQGNWTTVDGAQARGGAVAAGTSLRVRVAGRAGVPVDVRTVMLNLSAVGAKRPGYLTAYPCSSVPPSASNVNFDAGRVVANSAIVQLDEQGDVCLFALADTDVIVDITAYLDPRP